MVRKKLWRFSFIAAILLIGCQSEKLENSSIASTKTISQVENIEDYLITNIGISAFGGEIFCAYEPLNAEQGAESKIYLWTLCQEYYLEQESLIIGSGVSLPVVLRIQEKYGHYEVTDHLAPREGTYYEPDVRATFSQSTWSQILPQSNDEIQQYNYRVEKLQKDTEMQARSNFDMSMPHLPPNL